MHSQQLRFDGDVGPAVQVVGLVPEWTAPQGGSRSGFTPLEWLAIAIGQQEGMEARGGLFRLGALLRGLFGGPRVRRMAVDRLEVLSRIAARAQIGGGQPSDEDVILFRRAGYSESQLLLLLASLNQARLRHQEEIP
ncbi:hypothetical protein [Sphingomonas sp. TDK1]|uniref:hypothetical protein n=1 Tax=Sphingomonas sp. TDK1 TaxID=453247 RepID=UPI0012ECDB94|nr:hypothetical protein [Sphingomonas sp. TDK1]